MKNLLIFGTLLLLAADGLSFSLQSKTHNFPVPGTPTSVVRKTFLTRVNHFQPQDTRTARFAYYENLDHYRLAGPIYIFVGDHAFTTEWLSTGLMHDIAMEEGAALITSPHRYFGENIPTVSASFEDLEYLTLEQSLGDIALLINTLRISFPYSTRVILWGAEYGAKVATLARQKMPHLVNGVWASSGVFWSDMYISDTYMYMENVIQNIGGETCANQIRSAFEEMEDMIYAEQGAELADLLNLCSPVNVTSDLSLGFFYQGQIEFFRTALNLYHYDGLLQLCDDMNDNGITPLAAFGRWVASTFADIECWNFDYYSTIDLLRNIEWNQPGTDSGIRQWYYYKCTQLGSWHTTSPNNDLFPHRVRDTLYYYLCGDILGGSFDAALLYDSIDALNIQYGALNPGVSNVVYTNGVLDMWYPRGMRDVGTNPGSEVINIQNYAASADLTSISDSDSVYLREAKQRIQELVHEWSRP